MDDPRVMTWAPSPVYGSPIALGPSQRAVLDVALRLTAHGRRPELTLARLAELSGRPVSSVHDALGRLRALGLLGVSARMGRTGGHRLWRVNAPARRTLDASAHRRTIARMLRRFGATIAQAVGRPGTPPRPTGSGRWKHDGRNPSFMGRARDEALELGLQDSPTRGAVGPVPQPAPAIPPAGAGADPTERPWYDKGPSPSERESMTFGERMRRHGLGPWIDERPTHDR